MTNFCRLLASVLPGVFISAAWAQDVVTAPFEPDSGNLTIRCGILIDGIAEQPNTFQTVEIVEGRIESIGYSDREVDLDLSTDAILGRLDDFVTRSGFVITPVVVWGGPRLPFQKPRRRWLRWASS